MGSDGWTSGRSTVILYNENNNVEQWIHSSAHKSHGWLALGTRDPADLSSEATSSFVNTWMDDNLVYRLSDVVSNDPNCLNKGLGCESVYGALHLKDPGREW